MKSCRIASALASAVYVTLGTAEACGGALPKQQPAPLAARDLSPDASLPPPVVDGPPAVGPKDIDVHFIRGRTRITAPVCSRVFVVAITGAVTPPATIVDDVLQPGDVLVVKYPDPFYADVETLALRVIQPFACTVNDKPDPEIATRRARTEPELTWAHGTMHAHLDVRRDVSPGLYLGRLEADGAIPEHRHPDAIEILATVEASGTLVIDGAPRRVGPRQVVVIPKNALHSYQPDPGSKLVAVQMYAPPGPEQRFALFAAAEKDAGSSATADAGGK